MITLLDRNFCRRYFFVRDKISSFIKVIVLMSDKGNNFIKIKLTKADVNILYLFSYEILLI